MSEVIASIDDEIVCLQELYHRNDLSQVLRRLSGNGKNFYTLYAPSRHFSLLPSGLLILSRYRISRSIQRYFRTQAFDESMFARKGYQFAEIRVDSVSKLVVANTHLTAGGARHHPESKSANSIRERQIAELLREVRIWAGHDNIVICGDFNCGREVSKMNFDLFERNGFFDLQTVGGQPPGSTYNCRSSNFITWDPTNPLNVVSPHRSSPPQRIDHIFFTSEFSGRGFHATESRVFDATVPIGEGLMSTPSDHYGVRLKIRKL